MAREHSTQQAKHPNALSAAGPDTDMDIDLGADPPNRLRAIFTLRPREFY